MCERSIGKHMIHNGGLEGSLIFPIDHMTFAKMLFVWLQSQPSGNQKKKLFYNFVDIHPLNIYVQSDFEILQNSGRSGFCRLVVGPTRKLCKSHQAKAYSSLNLKI